MADDYLNSLASVVGDVIAPHAAAVDKDAKFPEASMRALGEAGLLGLVSAPAVGGMGHGAKAAALTVEGVAKACGSSAMVLCMHYAATFVAEQFGSEADRKALASGTGLGTLAFSEAGSRSHFWAPVSSARADGDEVVLDAEKSWVTSATRATHVVWSSRPVGGEGMSSIWMVPGGGAGYAPKGPFDGLGLRGNDSSPVTASGLRIPKTNLLGEDGKGMDVMLGAVLPRFNLMNAACSLGLIGGSMANTIEHVKGTRYQHLDSVLADLPTIRANLARQQIRYDATRALWLDACDAVEQGRADAMLRVLETKAAAGEAALEVLAACMRMCGGAAFRKDVGVERFFRDAQAASVMAPTTDQLYDFLGKALCGMPVF